MAAGIFAVAREEVKGDLHQEQPATGLVRVFTP
jgi:hypothetical protein